MRVSITAPFSEAESLSVSSSPCESGLTVAEAEVAFCASRAPSSAACSASKAATSALPFLSSLTRSIAAFSCLTLSEVCSISKSVALIARCSSSTDVHPPGSVRLRVFRSLALSIQTWGSRASLSWPIAAPFCSRICCRAGISRSTSDWILLRLPSRSFICERTTAIFFLSASTLVVVPSTTFAASSSSFSRRGGRSLRGARGATTAGVAEAPQSLAPADEAPQPSSGTLLASPQPPAEPPAPQPSADGRSQLSPILATA
mmetsp:Transcript_45385/g.108861  ORF Transcript_45385/g.108861 Transcript_45385/m.108861 type:complete len:260 (+) Transcript_45385:334-1113(+)